MDATTAGAVADLRAALRPTHPEIDALCSDAYLSAVLSVPGRAFDCARDAKVKGLLEWRRAYGVEALTAAFRREPDGTFRPVDGGVVGGGGDGAFAPSARLVAACRSGAFRLAGFDPASGRAVLVARTAVLDWWNTGVEDGVRYHVLVIEDALRRMRERNEGKGGAATAESMVLRVDASDMGLLPPPPGALYGLATLLQRAYPDRVHRIEVGPVSAALRALYGVAAPYLRPRSREKIALLDRAPNDAPDDAAASENEARQRSRAAIGDPFLG